MYDALTNTRVYRSKLTHEEAVAIVVSGRGTDFDPDVVDAFVAVQDRFRQLALALGGEGAGDTPEPAGG